MTTMTSSHQQHDDALVLVDCGQKKFSLGLLRQLLPDIETALFFAMTYSMGAAQLGILLNKLFDTTVVKALVGEGTEHSMDLQSYVVDVLPDTQQGEVSYVDTPPPGTVLPLLWEFHEVRVAENIQEVGRALVTAFERMPGTEGQMRFEHLSKMHRQRRTIGDYRAGLDYKDETGNLFIFDVSGSMSEPTVRSIVSEVVGMALKADAWLAIVSSNTYYWEPGKYSAAGVLSTAEFSGTHYEGLVPLLQKNWGKVVCVADYDSSTSAKSYIRNNSSGHIDEVIDISLVPRPTFLAECVGQLADKVTPMLISASSIVRGG